MKKCTECRGELINKGETSSGICDFCFDDDMDDWSDWGEVDDNDDFLWI